MTVDRQLQEQVLAALEWEPGIDAAHVGVIADAGVITLHGTVATFRQKWLVERAARHVSGVRAVANELDVLDAAPDGRSDSGLAAAVVNALAWESGLEDGAVQATVRHGWITLNGIVGDGARRAAAERAARQLRGVRGVTNALVVQQQEGRSA